MAWTVSTALQTYLAETGGLKQALTNGQIVFKEAGGQTVVACNIGTPNGNGLGSISFKPQSTPATLNGTNEITNAVINSSSASGSALYLTTDSVDDTALGGTGDITFDESSVAKDGVVAPGTITIDLTAITAA